MIGTPLHIVRFFVLFIVQVLLLNQIEIGFGIQLMAYPLFIFLLPVQTSKINLLLIAFAFGLIIDAFSNTYGLHTSAILLFALLKPMVLKLFDNGDGYDPLFETNVLNMGTFWFVKTFGVLLFIHHFWFFLIELFKINDIGFVFQKTLLSFPLSFLICILLQYLFVKKQKKG